jgi:hypothetical protein
LAERRARRIVYAGLDLARNRVELGGVDDEARTTVGELVAHSTPADAVHLICAPVATRSARKKLSREK